MKNFLFGLFTIILLSMLVLTFQANLERSVFQAGRGLWPDAWFLATLLDAYFEFVIFYVWVAYKEKTYASRILWFVLIMGLGNMAIALYGLLQLRKLQPGERRGKLLFREAT
jgi:hypothetical protein